MIVIALGANLMSALGPPEVTLAASLERLGELGVRQTETSRFYRTRAWPNPDDPPFVNAVALVSTMLSPAQLLKVLHSVETEFGRDRSSESAVRNAPRTLDLDLIDYKGLVQPGPPVLPHPRMRDRSFVLVPLRDVAPDWRHPESGETVDQLIEALGPELHMPVPR
jgi:2-amino-4-hydroxy-6-hydroxymethyldihydropteridine diphosphokinase